MPNTVTSGGSRNFENEGEGGTPKIIKVFWVGKVEFYYY
jgi:hypothetical protein